MTDPMELVRRLESNASLPICPYDRRSPDYWTTNDTDPCKFCGTKNEEGAPDLCRGADTRLFTEAAACIREMVERQLPAISKDGPYEIGRAGRFWLARQLLDSKLTDAEAYGIVAHHPAITDALPPAPGAEA